VLEVIDQLMADGVARGWTREREAADSIADGRRDERALAALVVINRISPF
jgi:hypothetical protein